MIAQTKLVEQGETPTEAGFRQHEADLVEEMKAVSKLPRADRLKNRMWRHFSRERHYVLGMPSEWLRQRFGVKFDNIEDDEDLLEQFAHFGRSVEGMFKGLSMDNIAKEMEAKGEAESYPGRLSEANAEFASLQVDPYQVENAVWQTARFIHEVVVTAKREGIDIKSALEAMEEAIKGDLLKPYGTSDEAN